MTNSLARSGGIVVVWLVVCLGLGAGCGPPAGPSSLVTNTGQARRLRPSELEVVSAEAAAHRGLVGKPMKREFGAGEDGTKLVEDLLAEARRLEAEAVSDITVTLVSRGEQGPMACRTAILPETVHETRTIPGRHALLSVQKPVRRMVTELHYRCHSVSKPQRRSHTTYRQVCHTESHPVTRTRTTYSYQYNSSSHSSRSVPRTETYTEHQSRQVCRSEPRFETRTEYVSENECRMEPVTQMVTRYEHQLESHYVPPRLETITHHRLHETEPACELLEPPAVSAAAPTDAADAGVASDREEGGAAGAVVAPLAAPLPANRIEAVFHFTPPKG